MIQGDGPAYKPILERMKSEGSNNVPHSTLPQDEKIRKDTISPHVKKSEFYFTLGVGNLAFSAWLIGAFPHYYWARHSTKLMIFLVYRFLEFKAQKWQYFLLDFCYTVNYWMFLYFAICLLKTNVSRFAFLRIFDVYGADLFRVAFTWCVGPLALSVAVFRNSLVFHSSKQLIITAVHLSPNLAVYGMRWWPSALEKDFPDTFHINCTDYFCNASIQQLLVLPIVLYIVLWTIPYTLFFFVFGRDMLEKGGYHHGWLHNRNIKLIKQFTSLTKDDYNKPFLYMLLHGLLCSLSFFLGPLLWNNFMLHSAYLLGILAVAINNGASYYFEVFDPKKALTSTLAASIFANHASGNSSETKKKN